MDAFVHQWSSNFGRTSLICGSSSNFHTAKNSQIICFHDRRSITIKHCRRKTIVMASRSWHESCFDRAYLLARALRRRSERFLLRYIDFGKKEVECLLKDNADLVLLAGWISELREKIEADLCLPWFRSFPDFLFWNQWINWKDVKSWDLKRFAVLIFYSLVMVLSCHGVYSSVQFLLYRRQKEMMLELLMDSLIPEPTPSNIKRFKKGIWRDIMPKGLKVKRITEESSRDMIHNISYIGEFSWEDNAYYNKKLPEHVTTIEQKLSTDESSDMSTSDNAIERKGTLNERISKWKEILHQDQFGEYSSALKAKYRFKLDKKEVLNSLVNNAEKKNVNSVRSRASWTSKRWWLYRPKLPYTYLLEKLDWSEVAAVVFDENMKRVYVTMKEGFPSEYIVDIPLDPYLFGIISSSGAEVEQVKKHAMHYIFKLLISFIPGIFLLLVIHRVTTILIDQNEEYNHKLHNKKVDSKYHPENFFLPTEKSSEESVHEELVLGGDVWDLMDELMMYMRNPMKFYKHGIPFVRGVLIFGPPGTGKTLFARTLAKESGLPFIFASGAEFNDSEEDGSSRIHDLFSMARRNAPSFVFIDEIDAIAGRYSQKDDRRCETFNALIGELDGEIETTGVDRFSKDQAVIFLCATNRKDELDPELVTPGRIDRHLRISLPNESQRVKIFATHCEGRQLSTDIDFNKFIARTVGYSGADIRNLVNEAAIMSLRNGHSKIFQEDFSDALDKQLLDDMGIILTEEEQKKCEERISLEKRRILAVHEAGHILLAHLFPSSDWHAFSQLMPGGKETSISVFHPREDVAALKLITFGYLKMQMTVAHGGRCAERVVFGDDVSDMGNDDLEKITKMAREMVISPQNQRLGLSCLLRKTNIPAHRRVENEELIKYVWDDPETTRIDMSFELSEIFMRELARYIEETEELAMKGLRENRHILLRIADHLIQKSRITGLEVKEMMKDVSPVMLEDLSSPNMSLAEDNLVHGESLYGPSYQPLDIYPPQIHRC